MLRPWNRHQAAPLPFFEEFPPPSGFALEAHKPLFIAFLAAWLVVLAGELLSVRTRSDWPLAAWALALTGAATSLNGLARRLPWQNVIATALVIGASAVCFEALAGRFSQEPRVMEPVSGGRGPGALIFNWSVPFVWIMILTNARGVTRLVMRPWRQTRFYGLWVITAASLLAALLEDAWSAPNAGNHLLAVAAVFFAVLTAASPWLINKRPVAQPTDTHPLVVWGLLTLLAVAAPLPGRVLGIALLMLATPWYARAMTAARARPVPVAPAK